RGVGRGGGRGSGTRDQKGHRTGAQLGRERRQPVVIIIRPTILHRDVLAVDVTGFLQAAIECSKLLAPGSGRATVKESNDRPPWRLCAGGQGPGKHASD